LQEGYRDLNFLVCATDATRGEPPTDDGFGGFGRSFAAQLCDQRVERLFLAADRQPGPNSYNGMFIKEGAIKKPSDTIVFGEKKNVLRRRRKSGWRWIIYMDLLEGWVTTADRVERGCHSALRVGTTSKSGADPIMPSPMAAPGISNLGGMFIPENLGRCDDLDRQVTFNSLNGRARWHRPNFRRAVNFSGGPENFGWRFKHVEIHGAPRPRQGFAHLHPGGPAGAQVRRGKRHHVQVRGAGRSKLNGGNETLPSRW
jgi:hypothetical protein